MTLLVTRVSADDEALALSHDAAAMLTPELDGRLHFHADGVVVGGGGTACPGRGPRTSPGRKR